MKMENQYRSDKVITKITLTKLGVHVWDLTKLLVSRARSAVTWRQCYKVKLNLSKDYFDATASNWNTSAHRAPWRVSLYKDRQSNRRVGVF